MSPGAPQTSRASRSTCRSSRSTLTGDQSMQVIRYPEGKRWVSLQLPKTLKADHSYQLKLNFSREVTTDIQLEK